MIWYSGGVIKPHRIITITIEEDGSQTYLKTDGLDCFLELGEVITRRASHVEPASRYERWAFTVLRFLFPETSKAAAWTRTWKCLWRVNTKPVGGPVLTWADIWQAKGDVKLLPWVATLSQYNRTACFSD